MTECVNCGYNRPNLVYLNDELGWMYECPMCYFHHDEENKYVTEQEAIRIWNDE